MEEGGGFAGEEAGEDFDAVVEAWVGEDFEAGADGSAFGVVGAVNEARNASLNDGAGAHGARFESDVERCTGEAIVGENAGCFTKDDDFRVSGGIVVANGAIAGAGDDFILVSEDGADGNFAGFGGCASLVEGELHEVKIGRHGNSQEE